MSDYKALDINIEARVKPPEVIWHQIPTPPFYSCRLSDLASEWQRRWS